MVKAVKLFALRVVDPTFAIEKVMKPANNPGTTRRI